MKKVDSLITGKAKRRASMDSDDDDDDKLEQIMQKREKVVEKEEEREVDTIMVVPNQERKKKKKKRKRSKSDQPTEGGPTKRRVTIKIENNKVRGKSIHTELILFRIPSARKSRNALAS